MTKMKLHLDELLGAILLGGMSLLTFVNVVNRYFFRRSIAFTEEITINLFVWITLLGIAIAFRKGANLKMTSVLELMNEKVKRAAIVVSGVLGVAIFAFVIWNSAREIYRNITFFRATSEALGIPTWIYSMGTPVFSLFIIKEIILSTIKRYKTATVPDVIDAELNLEMDTKEGDQ